MEGFPATAALRRASRPGAQELAAAHAEGAVGVREARCGVQEAGGTRFDRDHQSKRLRGNDRRAARGVIPPSLPRGGRIAARRERPCRDGTPRLDQFTLTAGQQLVGDDPGREYAGGRWGELARHDRTPGEHNGRRSPASAWDTIGRCRRRVWLIAGVLRIPKMTPATLLRTRASDRRARLRGSARHRICRNQ